jgi:hypothetical protein
MTKITNRPVRPAFAITPERISLGLATLWAALYSGAAFGEVSTGVDVTARAQVATNPYLAAGEFTGSESATLSISPLVLAGDEVTSLRLEGRVVHTEFSRRYDAVTNLGATAALKHKFSGNLDVTASVSYDRAVVGVEDILAPNGATVAGTGPVQLLPGDTSLNGLQQRRLFLNSDLGFHYRANSRDIFDLGSSYGSSSYPGGIGVQNYNSYGFRAAYGRQMSDAVTIGIQANWIKTDFSKVLVGDSRSYALQATVAAQLGPRLTAQVSAGPSFASIRTVNGIIRQTTIGGSVNLCSVGAVAKTCVYTSRSYQPSSLGGIRPLTNWGVSYSRRLDERSDIQGNAAFGTSRRFATAGAVTNGFARADLAYNRKFTQSMKGYASVGYSDSFKDVTNRRGNYQLNVGLTFLFGKKR